MTDGRLHWYASRLRTMGPAEVAWRVRRAAGDVVLAPLEARGRGALPSDPGWWQDMLAGWRRAEDRPLLLDRARAQRIAADAPDAVATVVAAAERVLAHRVQYFGYPEAHLGARIDWHRDPLSGYVWPRVPARRLDHRTTSADPKWIWELNRLQHLPWLAQAWLFTGRDAFAVEAFDQLDSWLEDNPVGRGIAWRGAFEAGIRAVSVLVALQGLRDHPRLDVERFRRVVTVLDAGARACWRERSLHSSANNHLVGELTGLATTALMLPELPAASRWRRRALAALSTEADRQVLPDGAGAEQAVGYQVFTAELLLVVATLLRSAGEDVPAPLTAAVRRSGGYLAALVADDEPTPRYGDDDEGFALRLGPSSHPTVPEHLALLAAYGASRSQPGAGVAGRWVQAATATGPPVRLLDPAAGVARSRHATDGGLVILHSRAAGRRQRVTVDVGPLGYLAIAAHGHADALALTWTLDGREVVVDPGTGSYYGHPAWRTAHRSTAAHATVAVDGEDSSTMAGAFLWSTRARVALGEVDLAAGVVEAEHDGYARLPDPVRHRRRVVATPDELGLVVLDVLDVPRVSRVSGVPGVPGVPGVLGSHEAVVSWPLAPGLRAEVVADGFRVLRGGRPLARVATAATVPWSTDVVLADEQTHLGWSSARLEAREPAALVRVRAAGPGTLAVVTVLRPAGEVSGEGPGEGPGAVAGLSVEAGASGITARWSQGSLRFTQELPTDGRGA